MVVLSAELEEVKDEVVYVVDVRKPRRDLAYRRRGEEGLTSNEQVELDGLKRFILFTMCKIRELTRVRKNRRKAVAEGKIRKWRKMHKMAISKYLSIAVGGYKLLYTVLLYLSECFV